MIGDRIKAIAEAWLIAMGLICLVSVGAAVLGTGAFIAAHFVAKFW